MDKSCLILEDADDMPDICAYCHILSRKRKNFCRELKEYMSIDVDKERHSKCPLSIKK